MRLSPVDLGSGPKPAGNGEVRYCCPLCGDQKYHLYANPVKGVWHCFRCGAAGRWVDEEWGLSRAGQAPPVSEGLERRAPDEVLDRVYRALLAALPLSESHLWHLLSERQMSPEQILAGQYRTLPASDVLREQVAEQVARVAGSPEGVPGFCQTVSGRWTIWGSTGLVVPVRNWAGSIWGIQIRRPQGDPRYVWLSSRGKPGGAPARAVYHVAWPGGQVKSRRVWLTEGPLKADVAAALLGEVVVAVPGVHSWRGSGVVDGILQAAKQDMRVVGVREVVLAYDADQAVNPHVRQAAVRLARALRLAGLQVKVAWWPLEHGKGLDDLLIAGHVPEIIGLREWAGGGYGVPEKAQVQAERPAMDLGGTSGEADGSSSNCGI